MNSRKQSLEEVGLPGVGVVVGWLGRRSEAYRELLRGSRDKAVVCRRRPRRIQSPEVNYISSGNLTHLSGRLIEERAGPVQVQVRQTNDKCWHRLLLLYCMLVPFSKGTASPNSGFQPTVV